MGIIKFSIIIFVTVLFQNCSFKLDYNPNNVIMDNKELILNSIYKELNLDTNKVKLNWYLNSIDRNIELMTMVTDSDSIDKLNKYIFVRENTKDKYKSAYENNASIIVNTSLPMQNLSNNKIFIVVQISSFYQNNFIGCSEYFFVFKKLKTGKILYVNHLESVKKINVGPPTNLPDIKIIDTLKVKNNMQRLDSIIKNRNNSIPDSIKVKMGIKN